MLRTRKRDAGRGKHSCPFNEPIHECGATKMIVPLNSNLIFIPLKRARTSHDTSNPTRPLPSHWACPHSLTALPFYPACQLTSLTTAPLWTLLVISRVLIFYTVVATWTLQLPDTRRAFNTRLSQAGSYLSDTIKLTRISPSSLLT